MIVLSTFQCPNKSMTTQVTRNTQRMHKDMLPKTLDEIIKALDIPIELLIAKRKGCL